MYKDAQTVHTSPEVMNMQLSQKEEMFLKEWESQEKLCEEKYRKAAQEAHDPQLARLFELLAAAEKTHAETIMQMKSGTVPMVGGGQGKPQMPQPAVSSVSPEQKQQDKFLCQDLLGMEKYVAGVYNTGLFEFRDTAMRDTLAHIQKEEQEHGKHIYDYMEVNQMYG